MGLYVDVWVVSGTKLEVAPAIVDMLVEPHRVPSFVVVPSVNDYRGNLVVEPEFVNEVSNVTSNPAVLTAVVGMLIYFCK